MFAEMEECASSSKAAAMDYVKINDSTGLVFATEERKLLLKKITIST